MDHEVECERDAVPFHPFGDAEFLGVRFVSGKFARGFLFSALKAQLEMIEARGDEFFEAFLIKRQTRRDQAGVESGGACGADDFGEIGARERLASGEVGLQHAQFGGFAQHARPGGGGKLAGPRASAPEDSSNRRSAADTGESARRQEPADLEWCSSTATAIIGCQARNGELALSICAGHRLLCDRNPHEIGASLEIEGALLLQALQISEDILLHLLRLRLRIQFLQVRDDLPRRCGFRRSARRFRGSGH